MDFAGLAAGPVEDLFAALPQETWQDAVPSAIPAQLDELDPMYGIGPQSIPPDQRVDLPPDEYDVAVTGARMGLQSGEPEQVGLALNTLANLSDAQKMEALACLSPAEQQALVEKAPPDQRERLTELVGATDNKDFKKGLWGEGEKAKLGREAGELKEELDKLVAAGADEKEIALARRRVAAAETGVKEIDEELAAIDDGNADVDDAIARKAREREIEIRFGINVTAEGYKESGGFFGGMTKTLKVWTKTELDQLGEALEHIPYDQLEGNPKLKEVRRAARFSHPEYHGDTKRIGGGYDRDTEILSIYDYSFQPDRMWNLHGESSELAGTDRPSNFQETLAHELGHASAHATEENQTALREATGWRDEPAGTPLGERDGRTYVKYDGKVMSVDSDRIPRNGAHTPDETPGTCDEGDAEGHHPDPWSYARSNYRDQFAESYTKALNTPELLHADLVSAPAERVAAAHANLDKARDSGTIEELMAAQAELEDAQGDQMAMAEQHRIMREKVFGMNHDKVKAAADSLAVSGGSPEREKLMEEFRAKADMAMTDEQLERLRGIYAQKLAGVP